MVMRRDSARCIVGEEAIKLIIRAGNATGTLPLCPTNSFSATLGNGYGFFDAQAGAPLGLTGLVLGYEITLACKCRRACSYWIGAHEISVGKTN